MTTRSFVITSEIFTFRFSGILTIDQDHTEVEFKHEDSELTEVTWLTIKAIKNMGRDNVVAGFNMANGDVVEFLST